MTLATPLVTPLTPRDLAAKLWRVSLLRGLVALALGACVFSRPISSPATLARVVAVYWIFDGLVALWASLFAAALATNRVFLVVRGVGGIGAALVLFALPLDEIFGPWRPGQIMLLILTMAPTLAVISLQIVMTTAIDLLIGLEVRRRIPGEWSLPLGAALSIVLSALVAATFFWPPTVLWRLLGAVGLVGGLSLVAGAFRLRPTGQSGMGRLTALVVALALLCGCASSGAGGWAKPGMTEQELGRDTMQCIALSQEVAPGRDGPRTVVDQSRYQRCMTDRGYTAAPAKLNPL